MATRRISAERIPATRRKDDMDSPCISVCVMNETTKMCEGCGRTIAEIASWSRLSPEERRRIMAELPRRKQKQVAR